MTMEAACTLLRHNAMIEFNPIPALAWRAIGVGLWPAARALRGEGQTFAKDRASAAHARADALRDGNNLWETARA